MASIHRGLARPGIGKVERPCGHALNPEPGRVSCRLHAGSRWVGNQNRPLWSLGIAAHWTAMPQGITLGLTITAAAKRKTIHFQWLLLADRGVSNSLRGAKQDIDIVHIFGTMVSVIRS